MKNFVKHFALVATLSALGVSAHAHPGHSMTDSSLSHLLTSPDHLLALGFSGVVVLLVAQCVTQPRLRRAMQYSGAALIAAACAIWGFAA